ncbi:MAG: carbohydrate ABC transporter substrate-binding protein [Clostridia bacterium]|nr:carbohydrate ABC transporter substrate-binding protein [Clostridia bacterium]
MRFLSKTISALLAAASMTALFAGCGKTSEETVKVNVWTPDSHSKSVMLELVDEWNKTKGRELGVEIVYTVKEGDIQQATEMAFASDQGPDLFSSVLIEKNRTAGNIVPLDELEGGQEWIDSMFEPGDYDGPAFKGDDGKVYCLPRNVNAFGLVYNKDMFKKYGIVDENGEPTPPETFEELREYAKRMTDPAAQDYGIIFPMKWNAFYSADVAQLLIGSTGKNHFDCVTGEFNLDGLKPIYEMYLGIKEDGSCFPGSESLDNDMARAYFAERNIGMKFAGSYDVGVFNNQFPAKCDWGVAPYPVADKNNKYLQHMGVGGWMALSTGAREKLGDAKALEVLKFFYGEDMQKRLFAEGMALPFNAEIAEGVEIKEGLKGWKEFNEIVKISTGGYTLASFDLTGEKGPQTVFMEDIWTGNVSVDDAISDLNTRLNAGMKKFYRNNPDKDFQKLLKPDWDIKRD